MPDGITEQLTERLALPRAHLAPANRAFNNTTPFTIEEIDMSRFGRIMGHVSGGILDTANSANIKVYWQSSAENNANYSNISGGNVSVITANNKEITTEIRSDQIPEGDRYARLCVLISVANALTSAQVFAATGHYRPANDYDVSGITRDVHA